MWTSRSYGLVSLASVGAATVFFLVCILTPEAFGQTMAEYGHAVGQGVASSAIAPKISPIDSPPPIQSNSSTSSVENRGSARIVEISPEEDRKVEGMQSRTGAATKESKVDWDRVR